MKKILSLFISATIATSSYGLEEHWIIDSGVIQIDKQQDGRYSYSFWRKGRGTNDSPDELIQNGTFELKQKQEYGADDSRYESGQFMKKMDVWNDFLSSQEGLRSGY